MTDEAPVQTVSAESDRPSVQPTGFAAVARQISGRTTDFLAIAIIACGVFAVSGHLSNWWNTPAEMVTGPDQTVPDVVGSEVAWPQIDIPVGMQPGSFPVRIERLILQADRSQVDETILTRLRGRLNSQASRNSAAPGSVPVSSAAKRLERLVKNIQATEEKPGVWKIYRLDEPGSPGFSAMFLGTRIQPPDGTEAASERLTAWAMALPWSQDEWKVFFFEWRDNHIDVIPIPPDSELTLSLQEPSGTELTAFRATDNTATRTAWQAYYSTQLSRGGWKPMREWTQSGTRSTARFENGTLAVELILRNTNDGLSGLATVIRQSGTDTPE